MQSSGVSKQSLSSQLFLSNCRSLKYCVLFNVISHQAETDLIAKETSKFKAKLQSLQDSRDYRIEWAESEGINIPGEPFNSQAS